MILHARKHAKLALNGDAALMRIFYDLTRQLHIFFKWKCGAVYHNRGIASLDRRCAGFKILAVIQMQRHRDRAVLGIFLYCIRDI